MREKYFTKSKVKQKSSEFKAELMGNGLDRDGYSLPHTTVLLILDMQEYFLEPESHAFIPSAEAIIPGINSLINEFEKRGLHIIHTQHIDKKEGEGMMNVWWENNLLEEDPLKNLTREVKFDNSQLVPKTQYDAFWQTNLDEMLKTKGITDIIITGVMTHLCCESTARSAFVRGFNVIFPIDGTATYNEEHHMGTLKNLAHGFAHVITLAEVVESLP